MTNDDMSDRPLSEFERRIAASAPPCDAAARDSVLFQAGLAQGRRTARRQAWSVGALASAASIALSLAVASWNMPTVLEPGSRPTTIPVRAAADAPEHRAPEHRASEGVERVVENVVPQGRTSDEGVLTPVGVLSRVGEPTSFEGVTAGRTGEETPTAEAGVWRAGMSLTNWDL